MARKAGDLGKALEAILAERRKMARAARKVVGMLNRALAKIGYRVVSAGAPAGPRRRRPKRRAVARKRRRRRGKK